MNPLVDPAARIVIGHRGCAARAPENTLEGLHQAIALGVDAVELDVRMSADGVAVLMHDATLNRTTNMRGRVDRLPLARLREADAGVRFPGGQTCRVPTLDEALSLLTDTPMVIELKTPSAAPEALRLLRHHGAEGRVLVDSMHAAALAPFAGTGIPRGASAAGVRALLGASLFGRDTGPLSFDALCVPPWYAGIPLPLQRFADAVRKAGRAMHVWTVNDPIYARTLWSWGVNGIITDDPGLLLPL